MMRFLLAITFIVVMSVKTQANESILTGDQPCYPGSSNDNPICFNVISIDPLKFGYNKNLPSNLNKVQYRLPVAAISLLALDPKTLLTSNYVMNDVMRLKDGDIGIFSPIVLESIQSIREELKAAVRITSGYRTPTKNTSVGGAKWSRHIFGDAVDISVPGVSGSTVEKICKKYGAFYTDTYSDGHVHCDWRMTSLNVSFFGPSTKSNFDIKLAQEDHLGSLYDSAEIFIEGRIRAGNIITLTSHMEDQEDSGGLVKRWVIFLPDGKRYQAKAQFARLRLVKGTYQIIHYIGSNVVLNKSIVVR